jgi:hypothetical protein
MNESTCPPLSRDEAFRIFEHERPRHERTRDLAHILAAHGFDADTDAIPVLAAITRWADSHVSAGLDAVFGEESSPSSGVR